MDFEFAVLAQALRSKKKSGCPRSEARSECDGLQPSQVESVPTDAESRGEVFSVETVETIFRDRRTESFPLRIFLDLVLLASFSPT